MGKATHPPHVGTRGWAGPCCVLYPRAAVLGTLARLPTPRARLLPAPILVAMETLRRGPGGGWGQGAAAAASSISGARPAGGRGHSGTPWPGQAGKGEGVCAVRGENGLHQVKVTCRMGPGGGAGPGRAGTPEPLSSLGRRGLDRASPAGGQADLRPDQLRARSPVRLPSSPPPGCSFHGNLARKGAGDCSGNFHFRELAGCIARHRAVWVGGSLAGPWTPGHPHRALCPRRRENGRRLTPICPALLCKGRFERPKGARSKRPAQGPAAVSRSSGDSRTWHQTWFHGG